MKRSLSILLVLVLVLSCVITGCADKEKNDYVVNNNGIINIGVLVPLLSDGSHIGLDIEKGIRYANELAPGVNIGSKHLVNVMYDDVCGDIDAIADKFISENVAAVICSGYDKETTDRVIDAFKNESIPVVFTDCYSDRIISEENVYSISIPYFYQNSVVSAYFIEQGFNTGAVVTSGDSYSSSVSKHFKEAFAGAGGESVSQYTFGGDDANFSAETISASELEFVYIYGTEEFTKSIAEKLKDAGADMPIVLSEIQDKNHLEDSKFNDIMFVSKFEKDDNNYIGTDFIKTYSNLKDVDTSDVTTAVVYGYDAYMLVYGALMSFNSGFGTVTSDSNNADADPSDGIKVSQIAQEITHISHMGVSDSITFGDNGLVNPNFLYLDAIKNTNAVMLNKYNYNNESK